MFAEQFRQFFPALRNAGVSQEESKSVYFDNAATALRPANVMENLVDSAYRANGNPHRAVHNPSVCSTKALEASRDAFAKFVNASCREEIIFTSGDTAALNLVAYSFSEAFLSEGDELICGIAEHHSNFVPWQQMALRKKAVFKVLDICEDGTYSPAALENLITDRTKIVCITQASNVLGVLNPVDELVKVAHKHNVPVLVDGAQGVVHQRIDVQKTDCDFYAFSLHKLYGPTGVGVLYGKKKWLESMPPFMFGGEMVDSVSVEKTSFAPLPLKFEAGTSNFNNIAAAEKALKIAELALSDNDLKEEYSRVSAYIQKSLETVDGLALYPSTFTRATKLPLFSFSVKGVHHEDLAILLSKMGVAARSGQMCAEPLMTRLGVTGLVRVSLLPYNTQEEAECFVECLQKAIKMLS